MGRELIKALVARGDEVFALARSADAVRTVSTLGAKPVNGDLSSKSEMKIGMAGSVCVFHCAADVAQWGDVKAIAKINVEGTRNVLEAAGRAGCQRIVYTSTVGCIGLPQMVDGQLKPADELKIPTSDQLCNDYKKSKFQAEAVAAKLFHEKGLPIVIVNPTAPVGPNDIKPTPTGRIIVDFLNRRMPAYLETGLNWVHVRDVVAGHILAAEKGRAGQRYILGHQDGNWTMLDTLKTLASLTKIPAPKTRIPYWLALRTAEINEYISFFTGKEPRVPMAGVLMAKHKMWYDPCKAIRELGLPQTPPKQAFGEAVQWFSTNGYAK